MTASDFASITHNGELCDAQGQLGPREFELVMRNQVCMHVTVHSLARICLIKTHTCNRFLEQPNKCSTATNTNSYLYYLSLRTLLRYPQVPKICLELNVINQYCFFFMRIQFVLLCGPLILPASTLRYAIYPKL